MQKTYSLGSLSLLGIVLVSKMGFAAPFSVGEPGVVWKDPAVTVCFATPEQAPLARVKDFIQVDDLKFAAFTAAAKLNLQSIIEAEFTKTRTGVHFIGWKDCVENDDSDLMMFTGTGDSEGRATIGENGDSTLNLAPVLERYSRRVIRYVSDGPGKPLRAVRRTVSATRWTYPSDDVYDSAKAEGYHYFRMETKLRPYVFLNNAIPDDALKAPEIFKLNALHEFGHATGLTHEHARAESKTDLNCKIAGLTPDEHESVTGGKFSLYDPNSIMSYCFNFAIQWYSGLSFNSSKYNLNIPDATLIQQKNTLADSSIQYTIRVGLSARDIHALRCLYGKDSGIDYDYTTCRADFAPF